MQAPSGSLCWSSQKGYEKQLRLVERALNPSQSLEDVLAIYIQSKEESQEDFSSHEPDLSDFDDDSCIDTLTDTLLEEIHQDEADTMAEVHL